MKKTLFLIALGALPFAAEAQYRIVQGRVYLLTDPTAPWTSFPNPMRVTGFLASGELKLTEVFYYQVKDPDEHLAGATWHHSHQDCSFGRQIILQNYPLGARLNVGDEISGGIIAMRSTGTFTTGSRSVGSSSFADNRGYAGQSRSSYGSETDGIYYDYGIDYQPPMRPLTPAEQLAASKKKHALEVRTFKWIYADATNGSPSAQASLGEYYLNGIGTPTNREAGIAWLQRAAAAGDPHSSNVLARLSQTNAVVNADP